MTMDFRAIAAECTSGSDEERISFPEVVRALVAVGVERYHADLLRGEKIFYRRDGENELVPSHPPGQAPATEFSADGIAAALRAVQGGTIKYREFCSRIASAGCVGYMAFLDGRRVHYYGRTGDCHVEHFPGAK